MSHPGKITRLPTSALGQLLGSQEAPPPKSEYKLDQWQMERNDAPLFRYIYRAHRPLRHLEFGTWQGFGACLCLEESPAKVWTINLPDGETKPDGSWAYSQPFAPGDRTLEGTEIKVFGTNETGPIVYHRTDSRGFIGRLYRERGLAHRVYQIYCDSRDWDITSYPPDFFDSALIDGGHQTDIVVSDTRKVLAVLRPGGLILWHDYCPHREIRERFESVQGVTAGIQTLLPELATQLKTLVWIDPSWILLGIKK